MTEWAIITGASEGIGRELARLFAAQHWNVVLVARNQARLKQLAGEFQDGYEVECRPLAVNLASPGAAGVVFAETSALRLGALVNNAGFGAYGRFTDLDLKIQAEMMQVNMRALVELTHLCLGPMLSRRHGRILNVASTAAFQPGPTVNVYYASKAFVYSFSYALAQELEGTGVTVTTLCPGLTRTRFFERAKLHMRSDWAAMEPRRVAELGYRGMMRGRRVVIPGLLNQAASFLAKRLPPRVTGFFVKRLHEPSSSATSLRNSG